ncbi:hypothetical protein EB796_007476 [Bugula neritina]|uniref:Uncharacterized protein n=1 Tax=Bugula neritina TaxID=10212 RepID=A0A7J7K7K7_BUGNE|nr:hypothetical protein EB796_007476 [Bugula neritina]
MQFTKHKDIKADGIDSLEVGQMLIRYIGHTPVRHQSNTCHIGHALVKYRSHAYKIKVIWLSHIGHTLVNTTGTATRTPAPFLWTLTPTH